MGDHPARGLWVRDLVLYALLGAITFAAKIVMAPLPNIEPVSLMIMLWGAELGYRSIFPTLVYVGLEWMVWGFGLWNINYLYIWPLLAGAAWLLRGMQSPLGWAVLSGAFGLFFGALCAPVYAISGGWAYGLSWWVAGIPFDLLHCIGNFSVALILFYPMRLLMKSLFTLKN